MSLVCGSSNSPNKSVDSRGNCVGMLSIEHTKTPGPLKLFVSLLRSASYKQNGVSMFVHSFINSMEPPGSAEISQIASIRCGNDGAPLLNGNHGVFAGRNNVFASGIVSNFGLPTAQYIPFTITDANGAIFVENVEMYRSGY